MAGKPVVALAAIAQTSPMVWIVRADSEIQSPLDMAGKRLMLMPPPESAELLAMLIAEGVDKDQIDLVPTSLNIDDLIDGTINAYDGYSSNEPYYLNQRGLDYRLIQPRDYGVNFYNDVLITRESLVEKRSAEVEAFRDATLKGWQFALNNIEETAAFIQEHYAPNKSLDHLIFEGKKLRELIIPELVEIGHMNPGRWETIGNFYRELGMTEGSMDLDRFLYSRQAEPDLAMQFRIAATALLVLALMSLVLFHFVRLNHRLRQEADRREEVEQELRNQQRQLYRLANTDNLTGLWNRKKFEEVAEKEIWRSHRYKHPLSLIFFDLDHFKIINDRYGHEIGDKVLREVAQSLRGVIRQSDCLCRWGGEEFLVLAPHSTLEDAVELAEKLRRAAMEIRISPNDFLSVSLGVAELHDKETIFQLIRRADQALYAAKSKGRNCVVAHKD